MPIERKNSFHLLLSDDEMKLLRLLSEQEGLNSSDYLRMLIRTMPSGSPHRAHLIQLGAALGGKVEYTKLIEAYRGVTKAKKKAR